MTEQYWQTKNGLVAIGDMTPDHLRNVLRQLIREKRILPPYRLKSAMLASIHSEQADIDVTAVLDTQKEDWEHEASMIRDYSDWLSWKGG